MPDAFLAAHRRMPIGRFGGTLAAMDAVILGCANQAGEDNRDASARGRASRPCWNAYRI